MIPSNEERELIAWARLARDRKKSVQRKICACRMRDLFDWVEGCELQMELSSGLESDNGGVALRAKRPKQKKTANPYGPPSLNVPG